MRWSRTAVVCEDLLACGQVSSASTQHNCRPGSASGQGDLGKVGLAVHRPAWELSSNLAHITRLFDTGDSGSMYLISVRRATSNECIYKDALPVQSSDDSPSKRWSTLHSNLEYDYE